MYCTLRDRIASLKDAGGGCVSPLGHSLPPSLSMDTNMATGSTKSTWILYSPQPITIIHLSRESLRILLVISLWFLCIVKRQFNSTASDVSWKQKQAGFSTRHLQCLVLKKF